MVIGICDDIKGCVEELHKKIEVCAKDIFDEFILLDYVSPKKLLEEIKNIDVVFLDIEMPEMDGIDVGKKIRVLNPECKIILETVTKDRYKDGYHINALRFITKPFEMEEIREALERVAQLEGENDVIEVYCNREKFNIKQKDISVVYAYNGAVEIKAGNIVYRKDLSLNAFKSELNPNLFGEVDRKVIVGFRHVTNYDKETVTVGDKRYVISVRRKKEFFNKYVEYDTRYRR